ncbi:MAG: metallophosphoesterase [archaeon]
MEVYVTGDTHGFIDIRKLEKWDKGKKLTKNDLLIILGDTGIVFDPLIKYDDSLSIQTNQEMNLWKKIDAFPWKTLFIDGNHCNFDRLFSDEFEEVTWLGDKMKKITDDIYYLQRGRIYNIAGKSLFTFGGGYSIDKESRRPHTSWWEQELPNKREIDFAISQLETVDNKVDFVITHSAPQDLINEIAFRQRWMRGTDEEKPLTDFLNWVQENVEYKEWHFGHFHFDHNFDDVHFCHYNFEPRRIV